MRPRHTKASDRGISATETVGSSVQADDDPEHRSRVAAACSTHWGCCAGSQGISIGRADRNSVRERVGAVAQGVPSRLPRGAQVSNRYVFHVKFPGKRIFLHRPSDVLPAGRKRYRSGLCATDSATEHRKIAEMHRPYHSDGLRVKSEPAIIRPIHFSDRFVRRPAYGIHHAFSHRI